MKLLGSLTKAISLLLITISAGVVGRAAPARVSVHEVHGSAKCLIAGVWQALEANTMLSAGSVIKTAANTTVDLLLLDSGTALRVLPDSELSLDRLDVMQGTDSTTTKLSLLAGAFVGAQRKLGPASMFEIKMATGSARIVGTEYLVRADGAVTCLSGAVSVNYNLPGNGGSVKVDVAAGFSFDPATGKVVPTTAEYLQNIIADVQTTANNAMVFKAGGATIVIKPTNLSPVHGGDDNGQGGDNNGQGNNGNGNGGNGNGNGKGNKP